MRIFEADQIHLSRENRIAELLHVNGRREVILRVVNHAAILQRSRGTVE